MKTMNVAKKFGSNPSNLAKNAAIATVGFLGTTYALAAPDGAAIATEIDGISAVVDQAGSSMITVFVGMMVFAVIIGMIMRKGK